MYILFFFIRPGMCEINIMYSIHLFVYISYDKNIVWSYKYYLWHVNYLRKII